MCFKRGLFKVILAMILVCALFSSAALAAGTIPSGIITGTKYSVTANKDGTFTLIMNETLGEGESFTWMTLQYGNLLPWISAYSAPADANGMVELADELFAEMGEVVDINPIGTALFDYALPMAFASGHTTSKTITLPKGSEVLFVGRTKPMSTQDGFSAQYGMITLGGTKLNKLEPGATGGNEMTDDPVIPPSTGDHTNLMLWTALAMVSVSALIGMRKRAKTR